MDADNYQRAWQAHSARTRVTVDVALLLKEVHRNQRDFLATLFRRDAIEVGAALLMLPYWFYKGMTRSLPWTWWLTVPAIIWVVGFFLVDRVRHPQTPSDPTESLLQCAKNLLTQVDHQIWLLRNLFWWYLVPFTISILVFFAHVTWQTSRDWREAFGVASLLFAFLVAFYYFIDYLNQRAVRVELEPRRQELLALLKCFGDETTSEGLAESTASAESPRILRRWLVVAALSFVIYALMVFVLASGITHSSYDRPAKIKGPAGTSLGRVVTDLRQEKKLVGLAAMVMVDGQVEAAAAQGERKIGSGVSVEIGDRWHLGGITKSITATMIARLVESGQIKWSDTVGQIFPSASLHAEWSPVTLRQLLTDTAGAPTNFPTGVLRQRPPLGIECSRARREAVLKVIADRPAYPPGEKFVYSNVGYTIAGAMAEQVTGASWEDLVKREVFEPLGLTKAGFGPPQSGDETLEQPRGHRKGLAGKVSLDDKADNAPIMGPSGSVNMTLENLCTFAREHMLGQRGRGKLLSAEAYKRLHTPELDAYACGWIKNEPSAAIPYTGYWHNGSNTMWYALVVFIPEKNMVVAVTSNDGDAALAEAAAWEIVKASSTQFNIENDPARRMSLPEKNP